MLLVIAGATGTGAQLAGDSLSLDSSIKPAADAFSNHESFRTLGLRSNCSTGRGPLQIGGGVALNAATCIPHPLAPHGAIALYVPAASATMSSTISLSGCVYICMTYPAPGPLKEPAVVPATNSNSLV